MAGHGLVICSGYEPLEGFANSAACIAQVLGARGFTVACCAGADATRDGIVRAWQAVIDRANGDDAIAIYYVGHGAITTNRKYAPGSDLPAVVQNICPSDYADTRDDDFRGITSWELALMVAAATRRTTNVTVILECCFAELMVRGDDPPRTRRVKPKLTRVALTRHLEELRARSSELAELDVHGNPFAVRIAASGQTDSAYQVLLPPAAGLQALGLALPPEDWIGGLTLRLAEVLAEIGTTPVSWRSIASELRARLVVQRPEIDGPISRVPFSLATIDARAFAVRSEGGTAILEAGRLLGVSVNDVYAVMPVGSTEVDPERIIEHLTIAEASATESRAARAPGNVDPLPAGAVALPIALAFARYPVRVVADDALRAELEHAIDASSRVRTATSADDPIAELRVHGHDLELHDRLGRLFAPAPYPDRLPAAILDLENLATERRLHDLAEHEGAAPSDVVVELLVMGDGQPEPRADHGEALGLGDAFALRLRNRADTPRYANIFNLGLRRRLTRLSGGSGIALPPGQVVYFGAELAGELEGYGLAWPDGLPADRPRLDTLLIVITPERADLSMLERDEHLGARGAMSPRQLLLDQLATGRPRGPAPAEPFAMIWRDYWLFPLQASLDLGAPQVDARPPGAPAAEPIAARLRMALTATIAPDRRVDVLVCARSPTSPVRATTILAPPAGPLEIWCDGLIGPADVYLWTSQRTGDRRTLSELLGDPGAPAELLRKADGDPLAPGASLQLAAMARAALRELDPAVVTAFRGTFGAADVGRHAYATADVSFALEVLEDVVIAGDAAPT